MASQLQAKLQTPSQISRPAQTSGSSGPRRTAPTARASTRQISSMIQRMPAASAMRSSTPPPAMSPIDCNKDANQCNHRDGDRQHDGCDDQAKDDPMRNQRLLHDPDLLSFLILQSIHTCCQGNGLLLRPGGLAAATANTEQLDLAPR